MPTRPFHIATSTPAGAGYAFYKANNQKDLARILETAGCALGGYLGGILPDRIDPPFHPGHRSLGHGFVPVAAAANFWNQGLEGWQNQLGRTWLSPIAVNRTSRNCVALIRRMGPPFAIWFSGRPRRWIRHSRRARLRNAALLAADKLKGHSNVD